MAAYNGRGAEWPEGGMIDMAKSPARIAEEATPAKCAPSPVAEYPYGLCISFDDDTLAKLGLDGELPQVGDIFEFCAVAKVTCASSNESIDPATGETKACKRVELQIIAMAPREDDAVEQAMQQSAARRRRFYGGSMQSYDRDVAAYNPGRDAGARP
jgi:hypothetical protein